MLALVRKMIRHGPSLRISPCLAVLVTGLVIAIALPVEPGAGQTPPAPAPDPVPDADPTPPSSGGSSGGSSGSPDSSGGGDSSGSPDNSGGGDSSGSSSGSTEASPPPTTSGGPESSTSSRDERQPEPKPEPKREKQHVEKPDRQAAPAPDARDPPARPARMALGVGGRSNGSPADLELFVLALSGALTVVLLLLAATPPRVLAGVSVALAARQRKVELGIGAVLLSLVFGLLAAQCGASLR